MNPFDLSGPSFLVFYIGMALIVAPGPGGGALAAEEKTTVVLGTATPGGGFPLYGGVVAEVVNATDPSLAIEPRNTKGSTENVPLLEQEKLDTHNFVAPRKLQFGFVFFITEKPLKPVPD